MMPRSSCLCRYCAPIVLWGDVFVCPASASSICLLGPYYSMLHIVGVCNPSVMMINIFGQGGEVKGSSLGCVFWVVCWGCMIKFSSVVTRLPYLSPLYRLIVLPRSLSLIMDVSSVLRPCFSMTSDLRMNIASFAYAFNRAHESAHVRVPSLS